MRAGRLSELRLWRVVGLVRFVGDVTEFGRSAVRLACALCRSGRSSRADASFWDFLDYRGRFPTWPWTGWSKVRLVGLGISSAIWVSVRIRGLVHTGPPSRRWE